jgi:S-adenosylmethionine hydrolase
MAVITLTTDWNTNDYYLAAFKGKMLSKCPDATLVDISHLVRPFDINQAAFIVGSCYRFYPKGTIHIIGVMSQAAPNRGYLVAEYKQQYFICADNGMVSLLFRQDLPEKVYSITIEGSSTFPEIDIFPEIAALIHKGRKPEEFGEIFVNYIKLNQTLPVIYPSMIVGNVMYIDSYNNVITNISRKEFEGIAKGRRFEILVQSNHYVIDHISTHYCENADADLIAVFNRLDYLEIAQSKGHLASLFSIHIQSDITVKFYDSPKNQPLIMRNTIPR